MELLVVMVQTVPLVLLVLVALAQLVVQVDQLVLLEPQEHEVQVVRQEILELAVRQDLLVLRLCSLYHWCMDCFPKLVTVPSSPTQQWKAPSLMVV
jgi:hypothetical protein